MLKLALPLESVPVPSKVAPSKNDTDPVGVPLPGDTGATVAENVTDWPNTLGFGDAESVVVVLA